MIQTQTRRKEAGSPPRPCVSGWAQVPRPLTCCSCTQALAEAKVASWAAEPTVTRGTAPPTPLHSPARPCCRQMVSMAPRMLCGEKAQGHCAAPASPGAHSAAGALGSDGPTWWGCWCPTATAATVWACSCVLTCESEGDRGPEEGALGQPGQALCGGHPSLCPDAWTSLSPHRSLHTGWGETPGPAPHVTWGKLLSLLQAACSAWRSCPEE